MGNGATTVDSRPDEYPAVGVATYSLVLMFVAYVLSFLDRQIISLLVGPIREQFGISDFQYSLLAGPAFALLYTFTGLPLGRLADRYSRKHIIAASVLFWSLATAACGTTKNFWQLFGARMAVGAGEAGLAPPAYSIITDSFRPKHFGYAMAFYKTGVKVGAGLALVIGGFLIDHFTRVGPLQVPMIGTVQPWQATMISVGLPGLVLALLVMTITEPKRKGLARSSSSDQQLAIGTVLRFLWKRRRVYLSLFLGSSMLAMAGYGSAAWYPEFFVRNYGMSKSAAGSSYGAVLLTAGILGVMLGPWVANKLAARGYKDAYVRSIMIATIITIVPSVAAPLMGSSTLTLLVLWPAVLTNSCYLGVMAASFQPITPNQMRGQATAIYLFVTSIIGMAAGASVLAAFTDFLYKDDGLLHYSIATANTIFYPTAVLLFWYCLAAYRKSMEEAGNWKLD